MQIEAIDVRAQIDLVGKSISYKNSLTRLCLCMTTISNKVNIVWKSFLECIVFKRTPLALVAETVPICLVARTSDKSSLVARYFISLQAVNMN